MKFGLLSAKLITTFNKEIRNIVKISLTTLVRIEPKFTIDDQVTRPVPRVTVFRCHVSQEPYTGGWCRPQTDGPALRAMAMAKWGNILIDNGKEEEARSVIWPLIEYDLGR